MNKLKYIIPIVVIALMFGACKYDFILPVVEETPVIVDPEDPNATVYGFAEYVQPIFDAKCASCHKTGSQTPDLTAGNSFAALNSSRYINKTTPAQSLIYTKPHPDASGNHPTYSATEASYVLAWITQGAKNN